MSNISDLCRSAAAAAKKFVSVGENVKNMMLDAIADAILANSEAIKQANEIDIDKAEKNGKDKTFVDRLTLTDSRIQLMAEGIRAVAALKDPVGEITEQYDLPSGLNVTKVRTPLGVVAIIYEARPNVTVDCAALTLKSGNAVVLRGSKDAINSNRALFQLMRNALISGGYDGEIIQFIDDESRESTLQLLQQSDFVDVVIPRGADQLKNWVLANAKMPVLASAGGNCHTYIENSADIAMADNIVFNAKVQRPSVCNATEQLLVDEEIAEKFLPLSLKRLSDAGVRIYGCDKTCKIYKDALKASNKDYYTEHLDYVISVKVVSGIDEAIDWINEHNSGHSECIVTDNIDKAHKFTSLVDAAAVYVNASTRFTDGFELGLGAEMGISTQKLHARGPIGLKELTSVKYVVTGSGQIRK